MELKVPVLVTQQQQLFVVYPSVVNTVQISQYSAPFVAAISKATVSDSLVGTNRYLAAMSISYEEALSTLQAMFGAPWTQDSLDTVLRHFQG